MNVLRQRDTWMNPAFGQIHHIEYYVQNLELSNQFWNWFMPCMGYSQSKQWECGISWSHSNGTYLVFVQVEDSFLEIKNNRRESGVNHIAFSGGSLQDLDRLEQDLHNHGLKILERDGDYLCFEDPNAFAIEVYALVKETAG